MERSDCHVLHDTGVLQRPALVQPALVVPGGQDDVAQGAARSQAGKQARALEER